MIISMITAKAKKRTPVAIPTVVWVARGHKITMYIECMLCMSVYMYGIIYTFWLRIISSKLVLIHNIPSPSIEILVFSVSNANTTCCCSICI